MKLYESVIKDTIALQSGREDKYLNTEFSYIISLPIWLPISILCALLLPTVLSLSPSNLLNRIFKTIFQRSDENSASYEIEKIRPLQPILIREVENMSSRPMPITELEENIPDEKMREIIMNVRKASGTNEAYKYLCSCLPGSKILARRPIRSIEMNLTQR